MWALIVGYRMWPVMGGRLCRPLRPLHGRPLIKAHLKYTPYIKDK